MSDFTKWVATEIDENTHRELYKQATVLGQHPKGLIADYIKRGLDEDGKKEDASFSLRLYNRVQEARSQEATRAQLEQLAWRYVKGSEEADIDALKDLCDEAGYSFEEITAAVMNYKNMPIINYDNGTGVAAAMAWLQKLLAEKPYPANMIFNLGAKQGFSRFVLKDAKRRINARSKREPQYWTWILEKEQEEVVEG